MASSIEISLLFFWVCAILNALLKLHQLRFIKKGLPPGTMGWPLFGETTKFISQGPSFMQNKCAKYGKFFKSHLLGSPTIVSMDPEVNKYILMNEAKGMVAGYPIAMVNILGKNNISAVHGSDHKRIRGALLNLVSPKMLRDEILPIIDHFMRSHVADWTNRVIDIQHKCKEMAFVSSLKQIANIESNTVRKVLFSKFLTLVSGTLSLPIYLPGTSYHRGFQARKNIVDILKRLMQERRASKKAHGDMLDYLLREEDNKYPLPDIEIVDMIITLLNSGFETVSKTTFMAVMYLHEHPDALHELRKEHFEIRAKKKAEDPINFEDLKSMKFSRAVIFETLRLATIVHGVLRRTIKELELNGFVIPKGWKIYVYTRKLHYDPTLYPDPHTFNPWRWLDRSLESHSYFLLFGGGVRQCPGKELGIAEISTFLHYFVTQYRWELAGKDKLLKFPRVEAPNGLRIRVSSY